MKYSQQFSLNNHDLLKGALMAAGGAAYGIIEPYFAAGNFTVDWTNVAKISFGSLVVYLLKNFLTPPPSKIVIDPAKTEIIHT